MRNPDISLFVAVPKEQVDEKYLIELSNSLVSQLLSQPQGLVLKIQPAEGVKMNKYQTNRRSYQGSKRGDLCSA